MAYSSILICAQLGTPLNLADQSCHSIGVSAWTTLSSRAMLNLGHLLAWPSEAGSLTITSYQRQPCNMAYFGHLLRALFQVTRLAACLQLDEHSSQSFANLPSSPLTRETHSLQPLAYSRKIASLGHLLRALFQVTRLAACLQLDEDSSEILANLQSSSLTRDTLSLQPLAYSCKMAYLRHLHRALFKVTRLPACLQLDDDSSERALLTFHNHLALSFAAHSPSTCILLQDSLLGTPSSSTLPSHSPSCLLATRRGLFREALLTFHLCLLPETPFRCNHLRALARWFTWDTFFEHSSKSLA